MSFFRSAGAAPSGVGGAPPLRPWPVVGNAGAGAGGGLGRYPGVRRGEQPADVVQEATLSLLAALRELSFAPTRDFYGLAAEHIRRRLRDLNRRHAQPHRDHAALGEAVGESD